MCFPYVNLCNADMCNLSKRNIRRQSHLFSVKSLQIKCIQEWGRSLLSNVFAAQQIIGSIVRHWMASRVAIVSRVTWYKLGATSSGGDYKISPRDIVSIFGAYESMATRERYQFRLCSFLSPVFCLKFLPDMLPLNITFMYVIPCFDSYKNSWTFLDNWIQIWCITEAGNDPVVTTVLWRCFLPGKQKNGQDQEPSR